MFLNMIFKIHFPITCLRLTFGGTIYGIGRHVIIGTQTFRLANDIITWTAWTKADRDGININLCWEVNIFAACLDELSHTEQSFVFMINFFQTCIISLLSGCNIGTGPSPHHWARARWHCILQVRSSVLCLRNVCFRWLWENLSSLQARTGITRIQTLLLYSHIWSHII